ALTFQNHTDCPLTDFGGKTSIFSHPVYLFLRKFSLQDSRGGSVKQAVVQALLKEGDIARTLLKDPQVMASYVELIFDMMKQGAEQAAVK
ncbi:hypothetical protein J4X96_26970, partial [Escherichia coli]